MGRRGPAPTPTRVLQLRGTYRADRHAGAEVHAALLTKPSRPPKNLGDVGRRIWRQTSKRLVASQLLTENDLGALESYCLAYERALDAESVIKAEGRTVRTPQGIKRHPELLTAEKARADMRIYEQRFGLTPADRARIKPARQKPPKASNPFADTAAEQ